MNEILNGIRIIKFFAWESSFLEKINIIRNLELDILKRNLLLRALSIFLWSSSPVFGIK